jgi:hypothetical protein
MWNFLLQFPAHLEDAVGVRESTGVGQIRVPHVETKWWGHAWCGFSCHNFRFLFKKIILYPSPGVTLGDA